jgi:hypothetical protein
MITTVSPKINVNKFFKRVSGFFIVCGDPTRDVHHSTGRWNIGVCLPRRLGRRS